RPPSISPLSLHVALPISAVDDRPSLLLAAAPIQPFGRCAETCLYLRHAQAARGQVAGFFLHALDQQRIAGTGDTRDSGEQGEDEDRKSTRLNSSHVKISY